MKPDSGTTARSLVEKYLLPAGHRVLETRPGSAATIVVTSAGGYRVDDAEMPPEAGFRLLTIGAATTAAGRPLFGFAVLPDGRDFPLGRAGVFHEFHRIVRPPLPPLVAARLVAEFAEPLSTARFLVEEADGTAAPPAEIREGPNRYVITLFTYSWRGREDEAVKAYQRWVVRIDGRTIDWRRTEMGWS